MKVCPPCGGVILDALRKELLKGIVCPSRGSYSYKALTAHLKDSLSPVRWSYSYRIIVRYKWFKFVPVRGSYSGALESEGFARKFVPRARELF